MTINIAELNTAVTGKSPQEIIEAVLAADPNSFVTTNFRSLKLMNLLN